MKDGKRVSAKLFGFILIMVMINSGFITLVNAELVIDQRSYPGSDPATYFEYNLRTTVLAQTFKTRYDNLAGVDLYVHKTYAGYVTFTIGVTGLGVSTTKQISNVPVLSGYSWVHIVFDEPIELTPNQIYKIAPRTDKDLNWVAIQDEYYYYYDDSAWINDEEEYWLDFGYRTYYDTDFIPEPKDTTPPTITLSQTTPNILWPPDQKLYDVEVTASWSDDQDPNPTVRVSVRSNERSIINGEGDGATRPDIVVLDNTHFQFRAERDGDGEGRVYTITYIVTDAAGNTASKSTTVFVPHDKQE